MPPKGSLPGPPCCRLDYADQRAQLPRSIRRLKPSSTGSPQERPLAPVRPARSPRRPLEEAVFAFSDPNIVCSSPPAGPGQVCRAGKWGTSLAASSSLGFQRDHDRGAGRSRRRPVGRGEAFQSARDVRSPAPRPRARGTARAGRLVVLAKEVTEGGDRRAGARPAGLDAEVRTAPRGRTRLPAALGRRGDQFVDPPSGRPRAEPDRP